MKKQNEYGAIYCILNVQNGKMYIGSSINPTRRKSEHFNKLRKNKHANPKLQNAFNKYGEASFKFEILAHEPRATLLSRENQFLNLFRPKYNISKDASAPMTGRKHSKETLERFKTRKTGKGIKKQAWSDEARANQIKARTGLKRTQEFKERRKLEALADNRSKFLDKSRELAKKKITDSLGNLHNSMVECAKFHEMSVSAVCDILKGRSKKTKKGIIFNYA